MEDFNLVTLNEGECEAMEAWLEGEFICFDDALESIGQPVKEPCRVCNNIFPAQRENCPCNEVGVDYVIDVAITLMEYNGYELTKTPSHYPLAKVARRNANKS